MGNYHALQGSQRLSALAAPELPQKDDLCGPFWALAVARLFGATVGGQEDAALAAGTRLWTGGTSLPPDVSGRRDYRFALPVTDDADRAGTDVTGVLDAIRSLAGAATGVLRVADPNSRWPPADLRVLFDSAGGAAGPLAVIANLATEQYLFPESPDAHDRYLADGDVSAYRASDWSVGHFAAVIGWRDGPGGRLYRIHDTYPLDTRATTGDPAVHDQPQDALARALARPGRGPGALLICGNVSDLDSFRRAAPAIGWDAT